MSNLVPGTLWIYFQNAILITIPVSLILLVWYRRAVSLGMRSNGSVQSDVEGLALENHEPGSQPRASADMATPVRPVSRMGSETLWRLRLAVIYAFAGAVASSVLTALFFGRGTVEFTAGRAFTVWYTFCWPIVPSIAALLVVSKRRAFLAFFLYVAAGAVLVFTESAFRKVAFDRTDIVPLDNAMLFLKFLLLQAWLPYVIILVTANRRLRSVSPLVLAGLLVFSYSALGLNYAVIALMDVGTARDLLVSFAGANFRHLLFLIAALPVGLACWWALRRLGRGFENKSFSDVQLMVDAWWLIVVFNAAILRSSDFGWWGLLCLLAFVAYRIVVDIGLTLWRITTIGEQAQRLLLLRVFGFQRRTEKLFDGIAQQWRFSGGVKIIAGTDLVSRVIDPGDIVSFVGGRLKQQFVQNTTDLVRKLHLLDEMRDPDGRFRVNKFFCHDNTWRATLQALLKRSDVVLMDLRGFSERNSGCQFELQQLAENSLLQRTVFVVDESTDSRLLEASLVETGRAVANSRDHAAGRINLVHTKTLSDAETVAVYRALQTCE